MPVFPPGAPVAVLLDGRPLPAYTRAYEAGGRVYAPLLPVVTRLADRIWFEGDALLIARDGRVVRVSFARRDPETLDALYVAIGPVLRALGENVTYEADARELDVRSPAPRVTSPEPFDPNAPSAAPRTVFTPEPVATPRPVWSGSPLPRRTPLPAGAPPALGQGVRES